MRALVCPELVDRLSAVVFVCSCQATVDMFLCVAVPRQHSVVLVFPA